MFFRKLLGNNDTKPDQRSGPPAGMQTMGANLQKRFSKGIQYNMKIIIKGDRNVGKTCLFHRLQGSKFREEYIPTEEIQVASIMWNYKATDDIVKVEVWDVVDKGKKKKKIEGLKLDTSADGMFEDPCLDAEFIDVYKGTQGVILVMDITKQWTFNYVDRELANVPAHIPVLILANHRDMGHHRTITQEQIQTMVEEHHRPKGSAQIRFAETSMRNAFGLKYIHKFFNLPYLQLQRETLLKQLETNAKEIKATNEELDLHGESEDQNYDLFLDSLTNKRRKEQEHLAEKALQDAKIKQDEQRTAELAAEALKEQGGTKSAPVTPVVPTAAPMREAPPAKPIPGLDLSTIAKPSKASSPTPAQPEVTGSSKSAPSTPITPPDTQAEQKASLMSRIFGSKKPKPKDIQEGDTLNLPTAAASGSMPTVKSVDDFAPDEALDASFLDDGKDEIRMDAVGDENSSSEDERNPLVVSDQDDLDLDDLPDKSAKPINVFNADLDLTSDEEDVGSGSVVVGNVEDYQSGSDSDKKTWTAPITNVLVNGRNSQALSNSKSSPPAMLNQQEQKKKNKKLSGSRESSSRETSEEKETKSSVPPTLLSMTDSGIRDSMVPKEDQAEDSEEEEEDGCVVVMKDLEDISDEETTTSSKPADSGLATDTTVDNDGSSTSDTKLGLGLEFEDLSVLEKGFDFNTGLPKGNDSVTSNNTEVSELEGSTKKKKKHKSKDRDRTKDSDRERSHKKSKSKKHREAEQSVDAAGEGSEKRRKKKNKKQDILHTYSHNQELEDFLGGPVADGSYESL